MEIYQFVSECVIVKMRA